MKNKLNVHTSSKSDEWETPKDLFDELNKEFNFTLDPCCTKENAKCKNNYTKNDDGLSKSWKNEIVFVNPPYGRKIGKWIKKSYEESLNGNIIVLLIPARTDTLYWHNYIFNKAEIVFIKGRLKFINRSLPSYNENGKLSPAPFPSAIIIYNGKNDIQKFTKRINKFI